MNNKAAKNRQFVLSPESRSRAGEFQTVSEQLAYLRGYAKPTPVQVLKAITIVVSLVAVLAWAVWGFSVHIAVLKYGTAIAFSTGWDAFGYWGLEAPMLIALLWCGWHRVVA